MSTEAATAFWTKLAELERARRQPFQVEARFAADARRATPVQLVLEDGEPRAVISHALATLRDQVDPQIIASRHPEQRAAQQWQSAFDSARASGRLTLNNACRVVLGPIYFPERQVHAYNANNEFRIRAADLAAWLPQLEQEGDYEYSLAELYELDVKDAVAESARPDANRIALAGIRAILNVAGSFDVSVRGVAVRVEIRTGSPAPWPRIADQLDEQADGPWPTPLSLACRWPTGATLLKVSAETWGNDKTYYGVVAITIRDDQAQPLVWITAPAEVWQAANDTVVDVRAHVTLSRRGVAGKVANVAAQKIIQLVQAADVPFSSAKRAEAYRIHVPSGRVLPSPEEALRRLTVIALAKQPFLSQANGSRLGVFDPTDAVDEVDLGGGVSKQALLPPLPGGVRSDKETFDKLVTWVSQETRPESALAGYVLEEFDTDDEALIAGCRRMLLTLGLGRATTSGLEITPAGVDYLRDSTSLRLFALLHQHFIGMLETLLAVRAAGGANADIVAALRTLPGRASEDAQISARRNWLFSLGGTERTERGEFLTPLGHAILAEHEGDTERHVLEAGEEDTAPDSSDAVEPVAAPPGWQSDRLDLRSASVQTHLGSLTLPPALLEQACAALSAGKHLLLVGPPGTGKTELALCLAKAAQAEGYCSGLFTSTASADWTTYETIGGYALQKDGGLAFRAGVFLRALEQWQWLLIDEINRADIDKAFGELMTVLSGKGADTPYLGPGNRPIGVGPELHRSHVMPKTFRVIATMNLWDKTSLFRLSYAVQRRFAIIHVGQPDAQTYAQLLQHEATRSWLEPPLRAAVTSRLVELFGVDRLLAIRPVGPAIPLDMIRYMRRRQAEHVGMAEALTMYLLPQLEGIEPHKAEALWESLAAAVASQADAEAYLRERFLEIFPLAKLAQG